MQCSFRLINVPLSDNFAGEFANLGNIASRCVSNNGTAANDEHFWVKMLATFAQSDEKYNNMRFIDNDIFAQQQPMHLDTSILHDWQKLRSI